MLAREGAELSATETIRLFQEQAGSLATLVPRYAHAAQVLAGSRYQQAAAQVLGTQLASQLTADPAWGAVVRALHAAEVAGWDPGQLLASACRSRELATARSTGEVLAWRITARIQDRPAPPRLDQPTESDARRYAALLTSIPALAGVHLDVGAATQIPALTIAAVVDQTAHPVPAALRHAALVTQILGPQAASRAQGETAWPALTAALRRAEHSGHDPARLLAAAANSRELTTARSITEVLAWRLGRHLTDNHERQEQAAERERGDTPRQAAETWRTLAWTLKAAENNGAAAETILTYAAGATDLAGILRIARQASPGQHHQAAATPFLPPWITRPPLHADAADGDIGAYLRDAADLITARVRDLARDAAQRQPAWATALGQPPADPAPHARWLHHTAIVAAYRDQYQVTTDDPRQVRPLRRTRPRRARRLLARRRISPHSPPHRRTRTRCPARPGHRQRPRPDRSRHLSRPARRRARRDPVRPGRPPGHPLVRGTRRDRRPRRDPARLRPPPDRRPHPARPPHPRRAQAASRQPSPAAHQTCRPRPTGGPTTRSRARSTPQQCPCSRAGGPARGARPAGHPGTTAPAQRPPRGRRSNPVPSRYRHPPGNSSMDLTPSPELFHALVVSTALCWAHEKSRLGHYLGPRLVWKWFISGLRSTSRPRIAACWLPSRHNDVSC